MPSHAATPSPVRAPQVVLATAVVRANERLGMSQADLSEILGVSASTVTRIAAGERGIEVESKEGQLAALYIRVFRSLDAVVGGDADNASKWFHANNTHLSGVPSVLVKRPEGLADVARYLDAMRGEL